MRSTGTISGRVPTSVPSVAMNCSPGQKGSAEAVSNEVFSSESKFGHRSPWPAFTQTVHPDSVSKREDCPGALKVGVKIELVVSRDWWSGELRELLSGSGTRVPG